MSNVPAWAEKIIRTVASDHRKRLPVVTWQTWNRHGTAGSVTGDNIFIRSGRSFLKAKLTLCHELGHWITGDGHSHDFWLKVWALYRQFRIPIGYALRDESHYRQGALVAYWESRDRRGRRPVLGRMTVITTVDAGPPP